MYLQSIHLTRLVSRLITVKPQQSEWLNTELFSAECGSTLKPCRVATANLVLYPTIIPAYVTGDLPNRVPNWLSMSAPALPPSCTQVLQSPASTVGWCDLYEEGCGPRPVRQLRDPRAQLLLARGWRLLRERGLGPAPDRGQ